MSDEKIAGGFVMGDGLQQGGVIEPRPLIWEHDQSEIVFLPKNAQVYPISLPLSEDRVREIVETAVEKALYPGGTINAHEHRRVEMVEENGKRWRGVLYRVDEHATDPMVPVAKGQEGA